jgi:hypothetical protein
MLIYFTAYYTATACDFHDKQRSDKPSLISDDLLQKTEGEIRANRCGTVREFHHIIPEVSYRPAPICANFSFSFLKKVFREQRWPTAPFFVVNISPPFGEFTAPLRHILPIHNVTINIKKVFVNFLWTFTFALRNRMTERTSHLAVLWIGAAISNTSHSNKADSTIAKRARLTGKGLRLVFRPFLLRSKHQAL